MQIYRTLEMSGYVPTQWRLRTLPVGAGALKQDKNIYTTHFHARLVPQLYHSLEHIPHISQL